MWSQQPVRRKTFISYHHADEDEVRRFISRFDHGADAFIARGIGASMAGDIINSGDSDYVMRRVRELYLRDSSITLVLIGNCTWSRRYVDWELQASLRHGPSTTANGLLGIKLPSFIDARGYPPRLNANLRNPAASATDCYARVYAMPGTVEQLRLYLDDAFRARSGRAHLINNSRDRLLYNRACGHSWH